MFRCISQFNSQPASSSRQSEKRKDFDLSKDNTLCMIVCNVYTTENIEKNKKSRMNERNRGKKRKFKRKIIVIHHENARILNAHARISTYSTTKQQNTK